MMEKYYVRDMIMIISMTAVFILILLWELWNFLTKKDKPDEKIMTADEYKQKIREIRTDWHKQMKDLKARYKIHKDVQKWEKELTIMMEDYIYEADRTDSYDKEENLEQLNMLMKSGIKRIRQGETPYDKKVFMSEEEEDRLAKKILKIGIISLFVYSALYLAGYFVLGLTVLLAIGLFPDGIPHKQNKTGTSNHQRIVSVKETFYILIMALVGWKFNQYIYSYIYSLPTPGMLIFLLMGLPVFYAFIYWVVKSYRKRQIKEL